MTVARSAERELFLVDGERRVSLGPATGNLITVLKLLRHGDVEPADLETPSARLGGLADDLARLAASGWLATAVSWDDTVLAEIRTFAPVAGPGPDLGRPIALSRFALLRRDGEAMVLESAVAAAQARLAGRETESLVFDLARPAELAALTGGSAAREATVRALAAAGFLVNVPGPEDESFRLRQWGAHEALFHGRSRWGALNGTAPVGPSTWAAGVFEVPPARRAAGSDGGRRVVLDRPPELKPALVPDGPSPLASPSTSPLTPSFFEVLEQRRSTRLHDPENPLDLASLAEFLFRAARVRSTFSYEGVEYSDRPYPSGGGAHEFELYIAARQVTGLAPGFYRYDPFDHALDVVSDSPATAEAFAASAARATTLPVPPQAVVVVSARFGRLLGRYRGMGYATVLKNVGVLYQTMYLVATALGLAPCGLGNGDVDLFAAASGADPWEEASVGEFALGSRPKG